MQKVPIGDGWFKIQRKPRRKRKDNVQDAEDDLPMRELNCEIPKVSAMKPAADKKDA